MITIEHRNHHIHDAGLFRKDWEFYTDASADQAYRRFEVAAADGVDARETLEFIKSVEDYGQVSDREARQISGGLRRYYDRMDGGARALAISFDQEFQRRVPELHDCSEQKLSGIDHQPWYRASLRTHDPEKAVMSGQELTDFNMILSLQVLAGITR